MPITTAVNNIGEYYSAHYLDTNFKKDIKETVKSWNELGSSSAPRKLMSLSGSYFSAKEKVLDAYTYKERINLFLEDEKVASLHLKIIESLGYSFTAYSDYPLEGGTSYIPVLSNIARYNRPWLVVCESVFTLPESNLPDGMPDEDPMTFFPIKGKIVAEENRSKLCTGDWSRAVGKIFQNEDAPRWVMLLGGSIIYLFDSHTYAQGRYLSFDLDDAYGRKEKDTFDILAAFLSKQTLCPDGESDEILHEKLEENSHKFAHGVSGKLQIAVREAIEILVNEWVDYRREKHLSFTEENFGSEIRKITPEELKHEALIFVYRLIFIFYAEARGGELDILPITDDSYRLGYSLEALRDFAEIPLTVSTENGFYFYHHIKQLFRLIHRGFNPESLNEDNILFFDKSANSPVFSMQPLMSRLFDPGATPLLDNAEFRNLALHEVIRRLSLSVDERSRTTGRVNYAELGINQLGAVYEGLLSYKGMFAESDLIQVKPKGKDIKDSKTQSWFVPKERLEEFLTDEVVRHNHQPVIYKKGTFILHLSGIDREQSASYYTPECLTKCLVEEAMRELVKDYQPEDADKILELKICEPAMGSGAFLNESTNQLAHKYLELKQKQLNKLIEPTAYVNEHRRVMHYIATRNLYGVDLNPLAVELGALSVWLGSIHQLLIEEGKNGGRDVYKPCATPWFNLRLRCGNSLIGASRRVWTTKQLINGKFYGTNTEIPKLLKPGEQRADNEIYHFLVFDEDMVSAHKDKTIKGYFSEESGEVAKWIGDNVKKKWNQNKIDQALDVCGLIDSHWKKYTEERLQALKETACTATVWPLSSSSEKALNNGPNLVDQEKVSAELESNSGSFQRLKLLMDSWCALWFWPLSDYESLPSAEAWLTAAELLLGGKPDQHTMNMMEVRLGFDVSNLFHIAQQELPDTEDLSNTITWYNVSYKIIKEQNFHHWELVFPEVLSEFAKNKGFDLILGNPPWIKSTWNDSPLLNDFEPKLGVKESKSAVYNRERHNLLRNEDNLQKYAELFYSTYGTIKFLCSNKFYSELAGLQTNLYKNFIVKSWGLLGENGIGGLLHPESVYDDPKGGILREEYYRRLRAHYHISNILGLFGEIDSRNVFSINIFGSENGKINFVNICNIFQPYTINNSIDHCDILSSVPNIKTENGKWETRGHSKRIIIINEDALSTFTELFETECKNLQARLPQIHSQQILDVLKKFTKNEKKLADYKNEYFGSEMFHESNGQRDGEIVRIENPSFVPQSTNEWVISGPHFYVGTPLAKTAQTNCNTNSSFEEIDLTSISEDYLPRAVYRPGDSEGNLDNFYNAISEWPKVQDTFFTLINSTNKKALEFILGETIKTYSVDKTKLGCSTARDFAYFEVYEGPINEVIRAYITFGKTSSKFLNYASQVKLKQGKPTEGQLKRLPLPITARYRTINRNLVQSSNERTLMVSVVPPGTTCIHAAMVRGFIDDKTMLIFASESISILFDFYIKITGKSFLSTSIKSLPILLEPKFIIDKIKHRGLRLFSLNSSYSDLWADQAKESIKTDSWTSKDSRLVYEFEHKWKDLNPNEWDWKTPLRSDFARRQAQLEIDVLVALAMDLTLDELLTIYRIQFPVMRGYELIDEYDSRGRHIPNTARRNRGGTEVRSARENPDWEDTNPLTVSWEIDEGRETVGKTFHPPFSKVDREEDYRIAYEEFKRRIG